MSLTNFCTLQAQEHRQLQIYHVSRYEFVHHLCIVCNAPCVCLFLGRLGCRPSRGKPLTRLGPDHGPRKRKWMGARLGFLRLGARAGNWDDPCTCVLRLSLLRGCALFSFFFFVTGSHPLTRSTAKESLPGPKRALLGEREIRELRMGLLSCDDCLICRVIIYRDL